MNRDKNRFQKILAQVPVDYYAKGVKNNFLQKYWHSKKWQHLVNFLKKPHGRLLDIGCADGTTTYQIKKRFPKLKITGLDYYKETIDFAKKTKPQIHFVHGDAHELPFGNETFDIVTAIEVLEHLEKPKKVLSEIKRVLKPGGKFIIVQDTDSLLFRTVWWFWTKSTGAVWINSHINCVPPKKLLETIRRSGFSINKIMYSNFKMEIFVEAVKK